MINIHKDFYCKEMFNWIDYAIDNGYKSYAEVEREDSFIIDNMIAVALKISGDDAIEAIAEVEEVRLTLHHLECYISSGKQEYALDLAETMLTGARKYYRDILSALFQEVYEEHQTNSWISAGLRPQQDNTTGEIEWRL